MKLRPFRSDLCGLLEVDHAKLANAKRQGAILGTGQARGPGGATRHHPARQIRGGRAVARTVRPAFRQRAVAGGIHARLTAGGAPGDRVRTRPCPRQPAARDHVLSYLVDTNVLSELRNRRADAKVVAWMQARPRQTLYLSVLSLGEIRKGIEGVADPAFRQTLTDWLEVKLPKYFLGRVLGIDAEGADRWGRVQASDGRTLPVIDALLAATALQHDLTLVTRNVKDFERLGVQLVNPWEGRASINHATLFFDGGRHARNPAGDDAIDIQALLDLPPGHQHCDGHVRAALELLDALGLAVAALEARQRPVVFLDVLGHQHDVPLGVLDEVGVAAAHQIGDLRHEAFAAHAPVQRNQHPATDRAATLVDARPRDARADVERGQPVLVFVQHLGGEAFDEGLLDHRHLARDVAAHVLLEISRIAGDDVRDRLLDLVAELAAPAAQLRLRGLAIDADSDAHSLGACRGSDRGDANRRARRW